MNFSIAGFGWRGFNCGCVAASVAGNEMRFSSNAKKRKKNLVSTQNYFQRLEQALADQRRSKGALAAHLGVALSTVSRWREAIPKADTVQQTADWLGVDAKWLMTGIKSENADYSSKVKEDVAVYGKKPEAEPTLADAMALLGEAIRLLEAVLKRGTESSAHDEHLIQRKEPEP